MKTLLNTNNEIIQKFDNFDEMRIMLYNNLNEHLQNVFGDKINNYSYFEMMDICDYMNNLNKIINKINGEFVDNIYLIDNEYIVYMTLDECEYNIFELNENDFLYVSNVADFFNMNYCNELTMYSYIIDKLNEQITINNINNCMGEM